MASGNRDVVMAGIERVFTRGSVAGLADGPLLARLGHGRDDDALEALVALHGPMVLGVCRRMLRDANDVDDAFQATFLVLVRKAKTLRNVDQLGPWMHRVAYRVAVRARSEAARRRRCDQKGARVEAMNDPDTLERGELRAVIDDELNRLPDKYRRPIVLCDLEGRSHEEAAGRLRSTQGVLRGRLDRGREKLRARLARRGLGFSTTAVASVLAAETSSAAVPAPLVAATVALCHASTATAVSTAAVTLAKGALGAMSLSKLKVSATLLFAGAALLTSLPFALRPPDEPQARQVALEPNDGQTIEGRVVDRGGRPIAGASVARGSGKNGTALDVTTTDAEGRFAFRDRGNGELILTVQARGHAPEMKRAKDAKTIEPIAFRLGPGRTVRGRVVDLESKPIAGATVAAGYWRDLQTLSWQATTDSEGRYRWDDAPADTVLIDIGSLGYTSKRYLTFAPNSPERSITMPRPRFVRGSVTDAETGKPVPKVSLITGYAGAADESPTWQFDQAQTASGARFEAKLGAEYRAFVRFLRIEAEGYLPQESRAIRSEEREPVLDIKLGRGAWLDGLVRGPDGAPLADAEVLVISPERGYLDTKGRPGPGFDDRILKTDHHGRFAFPQDKRPRQVVVMHDRGFSERTSAELAKSRELILRPWGRVEGTIQLGSRPGAGLSIDLEIPSELDRPGFGPRYRNETKTDAAGHFLFKRVVPGEVTISRVTTVNSLRGWFTNYHSQSITAQVSPGETFRVTLGGTGRPIVGHIRVPDSVAGTIPWATGMNVIQRRVPPVTPPAGLDEDASRQWYERWRRSDEGRAHAKAERQSYYVPVTPDGSFRVDDVLAGDYTLTIHIDKRPADAAQGVDNDEPLGTLRHEFTVPAIPGGRSDEPLDLGTLYLAVASTLKVGDRAPAFTTEPLFEGKPLGLEDANGKTLLLVFWATWCPGCLTQTPHLKDVQARYGKDPRFIMIGLSLNESREAARKYVQENGCNWPQGYLGARSNLKILVDYGVVSVSAILLIGPDGRVVARDLEGDGIRKAVDEALSTGR